MFRDHDKRKMRAECQCLGILDDGTESWGDLESRNPPKGSKQLRTFSAFLRVLVRIIPLICGFLRVFAGSGEIFFNVPTARLAGIRNRTIPEPNQQNRRVKPLKTR
jgi:hypothetical protein